MKIQDLPHWLLGAIVIAALYVFLYPVKAQHNHVDHHASYRDWVNGENRGCCNDQDCGALRNEDVRETKTGTEVRVEGQWCPVLRHHYLKSGNAVNGESHHACVLSNRTHSSSSPCERFICYQPPAGG